MRMTFLFSFSILWEVPNSWLMLAYIGQKKKKKVLQDNTGQHRTEVSNQTTAWYSEILRYNTFFKSFWKAGLMLLKRSLAASFPFHTKRLELLFFSLEKPMAIYTCYQDIHIRNSTNYACTIIKWCTKENVHTCWRREYSSVLWKAIVMSKIYQLAKDTTVQVTDYYTEK